jgi:hypothetical protein
MSVDAVDYTEQFALKGPEFGAGLSNHGPMAVDALVAMGRGDTVERWAEWYASRLDDRPSARDPIDAGGWREALGDIRRAGDWSAFFRRELSEQPWRDALQTWAGRLLPGIMAGATHGILRTAHAVRSLEGTETPQRIAELAEGLAYWAARYQELPSAEPAPGSLIVPDALARVAMLDNERRGRFLIFEQVRQLPAGTFAPAINLVDVDKAIEAFVDDITRTFVRQYLGHAGHAAIAFVHTVTAPSALRILAPLLGEATRRDAMRYTWQACAAIYGAYGRRGEPPAVSGGDVDSEDLIDRAVSARDEHAIKFTEACLREHRRSGDRAFLVAAADACARLRAS